jgi:hypothetical protein
MLDHCFAGSLLTRCLDEMRSQSGIFVPAFKFVCNLVVLTKVLCHWA